MQLWEVYGVVIRSVPIIVFNFVGVTLWLPIIGIKIREVLGGEKAGSAGR